LPSLLSDNDLGPGDSLPLGLNIVGFIVANDHSEPHFAFSWRRERQGAAFLANAQAAMDIR
jgi:hypothetical protein